MQKTIVMFDKDKFLVICDKLYNSYKKTVANVPPAVGGMLKGENFCFVALCKMFNVDVIIESGLYYGASTQMFVKCFPNKKIYTIDINVFPETRRIVSGHKNITIMEGDGNNLVPQVIDSISKSKKIAVYIDGPKDLSAIALAKTVVDKVEFVGLHDVGEIFTSSLNGRGNTTRATYDTFTSWENFAFITTEDWWANKYAHMNKNGLKWLQGHTDTGWPTRTDPYDRPYWNPILEKITPKGFGLGIGIKQ